MRTAKSRVIIRHFIVLSLLIFLGLAAPRCRQGTKAESATTNEGLPTLRGEAALTYLKNEGSYASLREAVNAAGASANPPAPAPIAMMKQEARLTANGGAAEDRLGWAVAINGDTAIVGAPNADISGDTNQGAAYIFTRSGQTWTQQQRLTVNSGDAFGYDVAISGNTAIVSAVGNDTGEHNPGSVHVFVRDGATWNWRQQLTGSDAVEGDLFGQSIVISGDTIIVGAVLDTVGANTFQGSAYLFTRSGGEWTERQKLTADNGAATDLFGISVDIDGDTAIVGATGANSDKGAAYIFVRSAAGWEQRQELRANNGATNDLFGTSVALSGDTALIGAPGDDVGSNANQGSAYVFFRSGETWARQQKLTTPDGAANDNFGGAVALSGDTAVIGASGKDLNGEDQGAAYLFSRSGETWSQQPRIFAASGKAEDKFGGAVAISGDSVLAGVAFDDIGDKENQGSAVVFVICTGLAQQRLLTENSHQFGNSVAISGDTAVVGADYDDVDGNEDQGSAYIYVRDGASWTQQQKLTASTGVEGDHFGDSVGISGNTVIIGAPGDGLGEPTDPGSAYIFVRNGTIWTEQQRLTPSDGLAEERFGRAVAISGDTAIVGACSGNFGPDISPGAAYVFVHNGSNWTEQQKLTASDGAANDRFGSSVAISGDTAVVGAYGDDIGANADQGSAYVFKRDGETWTQQKKLKASDGAASDLFGVSVAVSADTAIVGAWMNGSDGQGAAYVFVHDGENWPQQQKLTASDAMPQDNFGRSVAINGDVAVIGAINAGAAEGAAYIFARGGATWSQLQKLTPSDDDPLQQFGYSVSLSKGTVIAGAPFIDAAYIFDCVSCPAITLDPTTAPNGVAGRPYNQGIAASGGAEPYNYAVYSGALPPGLALDPVTGAISGTPALAGTFDFTIKATDCSLCPGRRNYSITIDCPTITVSPANPNLPAGLVGTPYNGAFTASSGLAPYAFSKGAGALPDGLTLDPVSGVLSGTPTASGTFSFAVRATDSAGCAGSTNYVLTINCPTISLRPVNPNLPSGVAGAPFNGAFTAIGGIAPYSFSITNGALPAGLALDAATGVLSGAPTRRDTFNFVIRATDRNGCVGWRQYRIVVN